MEQQEKYLFILDAANRMGIGGGHSLDCGCILCTMLLDLLADDPDITVEDVLAGFRSGYDAAQMVLGMYSPTEIAEHTINGQCHICGDPATAPRQPFCTEHQSLFKNKEKEE